MAETEFVEAEVGTREFLDADESEAADFDFGAGADASGAGKKVLEVLLSA